MREEKQRSCPPAGVGDTVVGLGVDVAGVGRVYPVSFSVTEAYDPELYTVTLRSAPARSTLTAPKPPQIARTGTLEAFVQAWVTTAPGHTESCVALQALRAVTVMAALVASAGSWLSTTV